MSVENRASILSERLVTARADHRRATHTLAMLLLELADERLYVPLGYASAAEYADRVLDLSPRDTREMLAVARKLRGLPLLNAAASIGDVDWSKVREIVRVATPDDEQSWITLAHSETCRTIERKVAEVRAERDGDVPVPDPIQGLTLRGAAADIAQFHAAFALWKASLGAEVELDHAEVMFLASLARDYLATADTDTRRSHTGEHHTLVIDVCPTCVGVTHHEVPVAEEIATTATCDARVVDVRPGPLQGHVTRSIPPRTRQIALARARRKCEVPGCRNGIFLDVHHIRPRENGGTHAVDNLVVLCDAHHRSAHSGYMGVLRAADGSIRVTRASDVLVPGWTRGAAGGEKSTPC